MTNRINELAGEIVPLHRLLREIVTVYEYETPGQLDTFIAETVPPGRLDGPLPRGGEPEKLLHALAPRVDPMFPHA